MKRLSKRQKQSLISSIRHWQRDIKDPLEEGIKIEMVEYEKRNRHLYFVDYPQKGNNAKVPCYSEDWGGACTKCPYKVYYGFRCLEVGSGHWRAFIKNPNLKTCIAMIKSMQKILEEDERMARDSLGGTGW